MTTITTHVLLARNMVAYWKGERERRTITAPNEPFGLLELIDQQIAKYEAQAEHLSNVQGEL